MSETSTFILSESELEKVNAWTTNGTNDIQPTVDQQVSAWKSEFILGLPAWDYLATGPGKTFVSGKMHAKARTLFAPDSKWSVANHATHRPNLEEIGLRHMTIDPSDPFTVRGVEFIDDREHPIRVVGRSERNGAFFVHPWHLTEFKATDVVEAPNAEAVEAPNAEAEALRAEVARLASALRLAEARHASDLAIISEVFWSEAERREWCDEAETAMNEINSRIHGSVRTERPVTSWRVRVDGPFSCGYVVFSQVEADDEEDAEEQVRAHLTSMSMDLHDGEHETGRWGGADESMLFLSSSNFTFDVTANR